MSQHNHFLAVLPEREQERVLSLGEVVSVAAGTVLHESGGVIRDVWFPFDSVSSLNASMENGSEAEVAIIGHEGLVGVTALLGGTDTTWNEAAVLLPGRAMRVPVDRLAHQAKASASLRLLLQRYAQALLVQTSQTAACNRFHSIEQRLGRCLLALHDRVNGDELPLTHERLAVILGSLRPGVTLAAQRLQDQGVIRYRRGHITVVDRARLADTACECYETVSSEYARLLAGDAVARLAESADLADETLRAVNSRLMVAAIREQRAREAAENANELRSRFFDTLSRELHSPLAAILGWSDMLQSRDVDDALLRDAIDVVRHNADAQQHLIDDMLELQRVRSGHVQLHLQPLDVSAAVRAAVRIIRPTADATSIAVTVIAGEPFTVNADGGRLEQLLTRVLENAVAFTPRGGSIAVRSTATEGQVQIEVRVSGEPRRATPVFTLELGMGLSLAIVERLVALHGGTLDVESADDGNAPVFTVRLSRGARPAAPNAVSPRARPDTRFDAS